MGTTIKDDQKERRRQAMFASMRGSGLVGWPSAPEYDFDGEASLLDAIRSGAVLTSNDTPSCEHLATRRCERKRPTLAQMLREYALAYDFHIEGLSAAPSCVREPRIDTPPVKTKKRMTVSAAKQIRREVQKYADLADVVQQPSAAFEQFVRQAFGDKGEIDYHDLRNEALAAGVDWLVEMECLKPYQRYDAGFYFVRPKWL